MLIAALVALAIGQSCPQLPEQPNFIYIVLDDHNVEQSRFLPTSYSSTTALVFANAFTPNAVCAPSRASVLTGLYPHNHKNLYTNAPLGGFNKFRDDCMEKDTIATRLEQHGYRTIFMGKYINGYPGTTPTYIPPGWSDWFGIYPGNSYYDWSAVDNGTVITVGGTVADYETHRIRDRAVDRINQANADGRPFFMYIAPLAPHQPSSPSAPYMNAFPSGLPAPRVLSFNEDDVSDKPPPINTYPLLTATQIQSIDTLYRQRARTLLSVEDMIAAIRSALAANNLLDNTYLIFSSDHGFHFGSHRSIYGKGTSYEEDIRIPLVVQKPGIVARAVDALVLNLDLYPTILELAGITHPVKDGRSLAPWFRGETPSSWRQDILLSHWGLTAGRRDPAVRTMNEIYMEHWVTSAQPAVPEYYNLTTDPGQLVNQPAMAPASLVSRLAQIKNCSGTSCP